VVYYTVALVSCINDGTGMTGLVLILFLMFSIVVTAVKSSVCVKTTTLQTMLKKGILGNNTQGHDECTVLIVQLVLSLSCRQVVFLVAINFIIYDGGLFVKL
jgi:hypothetical protein